MREWAPFCTRGPCIIVPYLLSVCYGPVPCPSSLPLGPRPSVWVMTLEPRGFPGCSMAGRRWWERSLLGFPASLARHVKNWSIVPGNNGLWKCAMQGCGGLHRKLPLTFSLGEQSLGSACSPHPVPVPLRSAVVRRRPWVSFGLGQIWWMPVRCVYAGLLSRSPGLSVAGMLTASQTS